MATAACRCKNSAHLARKVCVLPETASAAAISAPVTARNVPRAIAHNAQEWNGHSVPREIVRVRKVVKKLAKMAHASANAAHAMVSPRLVKETVARVDLVVPAEVVIVRILLSSSHRWTKMAMAN